MVEQVCLAPHCTASLHAMATDDSDREAIEKYNSAVYCISVERSRMRHRLEILRNEQESNSDQTPANKLPAGY